jgi:UDP-N-acetylglucosamine 2-epimerase (non-hydrolysing)
MAPIMCELKRRAMDYTFVYTAQHRETITELLDNFGLAGPDVVLTELDFEADTRFSFARWFLHTCRSVVFGARGVIDRPGVLLTHGDTVTTVLGALLGKLSGCTVVHVESGLRSFNIWEPFPEEHNRLITFRLSDHFICPNRRAAENLSGYEGAKVLTGQNTMYDALQMALRSDRAGLPEDLPASYAVASIHRYENIFDRERLQEGVLWAVERAAERVPVLFVLHPTTRKALRRYGLMERLESNPAIMLRSRYDYFTFAQLLAGAQFVLTDGGSNQEELYYLGVPCLLLREATERDEGMGGNVRMFGFDREKLTAFFSDWEQCRCGPVRVERSPCSSAVDFVVAVVRNLPALRRLGAES